MSQIKSLLTALGVLNDDEKVSITNTIVMLFVFITAFKSLFGGLNLTLGPIDWKIQELDMSASLPMLFSLLNYGHKRMIVAGATSEQEKEGQ